MPGMVPGSIPDPYAQPAYGYGAAPGGFPAPGYGQPTGFGAPGGFY